MGREHRHRCLPLIVTLLPFLLFILFLFFIIILPTDILFILSASQTFLSSQLFPIPAVVEVHPPFFVIPLDDILPWFFRFWILSVFLVLSPFSVSFFQSAEMESSRLRLSSLLPFFHPSTFDLKPRGSSISFACSVFFYFRFFSLLSWRPGVCAFVVSFYLLPCDIRLFNKEQYYSYS